jgi:hypothetical protein
MARSSPDSTTAIPRFRGSGPGGTLTEADARTLLDEHARSGRSLKSFAASHGLTGERLGWWRGRFRDADAAPAAPRSVPAVSFVPVTLAAPAVPPLATLPPPDPRPAAPAPATTAYELVLGGAHTLRIPADFHDASLARLLRVLTEAL